jgi:hypothetical protein
MIVAVLKLIIFTSVVNRIINTSRNERVTVNNYMFRPKASIFRLSQLQFCSKSVIYICLYRIVILRSQHRITCYNSDYLVRCLVGQWMVRCGSAWLGVYWEA